MAAVSTMTLSETEGAAGLAALEASLIFVLEGAKVPVLAQQILGHIGYTTLALFAKVGSTEAEVKEFMTEDMLMATTVGGGVRLARASLLVAWDAARRRVDKRLARPMGCRGRSSRATIWRRGGRMRRFAKAPTVGSNSFRRSPRPKATWKRCWRTLSRSPCPRY